VDEGKLALEDAPSHPERSTLFKAYTGYSGSSAEPQLRVWDVEDGDRYLLCTDGLHTVVDGAAIEDCLAGAADPETATRKLVNLANAAGGPDNIACAVADVTLG
jgi:protein phosphatase